MQRLRWDNPTKYALIIFFSNLYLYIPVATLYLQGHGLSYMQINSLWGIIVATLFLAEVPTGILADRVGRVRAVQTALALQVVGEVIFLFGSNYLHFAAAAVMGGLGFAFSSGSADALIYDSLLAEERAEQMSKVMGGIGAAQRTANLLAFGASALLTMQLTQAGFRIAVAITAVMVFVGWLLTLTLREAPMAAGDDEPGSLELVRRGLATVRDNRLFRNLALLTIATVPFVDYLMNLYQPYFVEAGVPGIWLGLGLAAASLVGIGASRYAYLLAEWLPPARSLLLVTALPGLLYLLFAATSRPVGMVLVFCLLYGSTALKDPLFAGEMNRHMGSQNRATLLSLVNMVAGIYVALMGLLIGYIGDQTLTGAFLFTGLVVLAGALFFRLRP